MEQDTSSKLSLDEIHTRMGMIVTAEGKARARRRLRETAAARDHDARAALIMRLRTGQA
ncbi:hypothetical protein AMIS_38850 [Actinoplanes missouriensis 431]|uniref:Uncharacterized protein n=1 Tax=Actinoplanes missouriensis (strain ATCC 14538 / DSM 43046 / CBS 188.64 / JCM 3121 / NBRC 102363 / NCIMB 12654 / NRRL B-3342 / UNCC 431) TaxID=512565 RepID=I0H7W8_ACTM4|nr:hypothetical protein [Actinoplanes missouriensis]BAL89105.1 hypothetical protein AMIS_38850 [Actinoplanes missouriensis 431]